MSTMNCPLCKAEFEVPDLPGRSSVCCPACGGEIEAPQRAMPSARIAPVPQAPDGAEPDPLAAYRGDTTLVSKPPPGEQEGEKFGPFDLVGKLSSSDIAVTYRARDRAKGMVVALKVLAPGKTATREEVAVIVERARRARELSHHGIVKVIEVGRHKGTDYIASEFIAGKGLASLIEAGPLSSGQALELANKIALALDRAHDAGVVHGNLKPSNVILDEDGKPHLADFGLARELWRMTPDDLRGSADAGLPLPHYTSPEQLAGAEPTPRSDVYGVGALLYHMVTRHVPFPGKSLLEVVLEVNRGEPAPPGTINIRVPPVVGGIIMKCLQKEPAHRFQTAGELAGEIQRYLHGGKVRAAPPGPARRLARALGRRWRVTVGVALLGAAVVGGAYVAARSERLAGLLGLAPRGASGGEAERLRRAGVADFHAGRHPQAAEAFRQARDLRPDDAGLRYLYSVALWHAGGDAGEVARAMAEALRLDPARARSARFQYEYARACERASMPTEARAAFERVRRLDGSFKKGRVAAHLEGLGSQRR